MVTLSPTRLPSSTRQSQTFSLPQQVANFLALRHGMAMYPVHPLSRYQLPGLNSIVLAGNCQGPACKLNGLRPLLAFFCPRSYSVGFNSVNLCYTTKLINLIGLSIPRRRMLTLYKDVFSLDLSQPRAWIYVPFDMILAGLSAVLDTIIWLATCFAFAGPMLMSGLYEAYLDNLLLRFVQEQTKARHLTLDMTARLLFVLLCGNLDLDPGLKSNDIQLVLSRDQGDSDLWPNYKHFPVSGPFNTDSAWTHIEYMIHPLRTYRDMAYLTPRQWPIHDVNCKIPDCKKPECLESPLPRTQDTVRLIRQTKTQVNISKLRRIQLIQLSFVPYCNVKCHLVQQWAHLLYSTWARLHTRS